MDSEEIMLLKKLRDDVDKLQVAQHSFAIIEKSLGKNWQAETGTSGETGADLVSLGEPAKTKLIHSLLVNIAGLTSGAKITIKLFMKINGVERKLYGTTFTVGTDPNGCWVINGTLAIHDVLRIEAQSDNASDNGKPIAYTAVVENM